ncbi:MAG: four helix bundle protein [Flavobacteriaceae bacterium]|jgi:four helix bundle protein|nr:four helix bundle protein [Flavobacteriaceae bacterium]
MENFKTFEELECWKEARKLRNHIKDNLIPKLPDFEKYNLASQISRSSRSVGNNIAEGFGRFNYQENIQFCRMARGSLTETLDHSIITFDENYITEKELEEIRIIYNRTLLLINGFIKYLKSKQ